MDIGIWLKWWSEVNGQHMTLYILVYFLLGFGYSVGIGGYAWFVKIIRIDIFIATYVHLGQLPLLLALRQEENCTKFCSL
jgi:hypothetical protein